MKHRLQQLKFSKKRLSFGIGIIAVLLTVNTVTYAASNSKNIIDLSSKGVRIYKNTNPALKSFVSGKKHPN